MESPKPSELLDKPEPVSRSELQLDMSGIYNFARSREDVLGMLSIGFGRIVGEAVYRRFTAADEEIERQGGAGRQEIRVELKPWSFTLKIREEDPSKEIPGISDVKEKITTILDGEGSSTKKAEQEKIEISLDEIPGFSNELSNYFATGFGGPYAPTARVEKEGGKLFAVVTWDTNPEEVTN